MTAATRDELITNYLIYLFTESDEQELAAFVTALRRSLYRSEHAMLKGIFRQYRDSIMAVLDDDIAEEPARSTQRLSRLALDRDKLNNISL